MTDAADTFRLGLDELDRPEPVDAADGVELHVVIVWRFTPEGEPPRGWRYGKSIPAWVEGDALRDQRRYVIAQARESEQLGRGRITTRVLSIEAWEAEADAARDAYHAVAAEMPCPLSDLDHGVVRAAQQYADELDLTWPPRPVVDGWAVTITSVAL